MWKCKHCGGKVYAIVTSKESKTFNLGKNGTIKKCIRKYTPKTIGINYLCNKCGKYYEDDEVLQNIAYWED